MAAVGARATQLNAQVARDGNPEARTSQLVVQVATYGAGAEFSRATQLNAQAARDGNPECRLTGIPTLVAYRTGVPDDFTMHAWTFDFDGHSFYVLNLGSQGSWAYDLATGQWSQFKTLGMDVWNAVIGTRWKDDVYVAADVQNALLWRIDPSEALDEGTKQMVRQVTGFVEARSRDKRAVASVRVMASTGFTQGTSPTVQLRWSDDKGRNFYDAGSLVLLDDGEFQELAWRSGGSFGAPGRLFEVTDTGGPVRIDGADVFFEGEE